MNNISITEKDNGQVSLVNTPTGEIVLSSPSIVKLQLDRNDIASMTRSGNDLVVTLHSGERVVLKNFYAAGEQGASELVLEESDGALWWIKNPAEQSQFEAITSLDDIMSGYAEAEGGGFSNLWMGLGALAGLTGGVIALASGGGNNRHETPSPTAPNAPADLVVAEDGAAISGNAEPGSTVTVTDADGNNLGSVEVGEDGSFTIPLNPPPTNGESITVIVSDAAGNSSSTTITAPDTTAPDAPTDLAVAGDGTAISGNAEPGSTVTVTDGGGNNLGSVEVGEDGSFTVPLNPPPTNGESITVIVSDAAGNSSSTTVTAPDTTAPDAPTDLAVAGDGTAVSGNAEPGSTVTVTDANGTTLGSAVANADGSFTVPLTPPAANGEVLTVTATDAAGNISESINTTAPDTTAPDVPTDLAVAGDGTTVSGNAEPGSTVTVTDGDGNNLGSVEVGEDGSFTVPLNPPPTNGESITVIVSDAAGNSSSMTVTAPDTTAPDAPTNLAVAEDGTAVSGNVEPGSTVTVTDADGNNLGSVEVGEDGSFTVPLNPPLTNGETVTATATDTAGNVSEPTMASAPTLTEPEAPDAPTNLAVAGDGTTVSGNAEPGSTVTVTDGGGNTLGSVEVGEDGSFTVPLNPPPTNGESLTVIVSDAAGNSSSTTITAPDTTAPDAPTNLAVAGDGTTVSGNAEPGSTVTVTDGNGNNLGSVDVGEDGSFTVPLTPPPTNGESLTVIVSDAAGNSSSTTITAPDTTAPDAPTNLAVAGDGTAVSGNAEPGSTVTVTDGSGNTLGS
ncbi:Ig-like domain-containing protein, partial [Pectobacterium cacticida]|uniref:Ig-like domain-containing protein n=1 Tax=Pectobacterium cacticida TaxID=69221 RepID=UPI002FF1B1A4